MTDDEKIIREALAAGPTPGPWSKAGFRVTAKELGFDRVADTEYDNDSMAENAAFIAACSPDRIERVLAESERLRKEDEIKATANAHLLAEVERLRAELVEAKRQVQCDCDLRTRLVGDGCEKCNPAQTIEYLREQVEELEIELADAALDAERYRWLRAQHWDTSKLAVVVDPKRAVKLGHDLPSLDRLDAVIDDAMHKEVGE